jgi:hypothetical protein
MTIPYQPYNNQVGVLMSFVVSDPGIKHELSLALVSYDSYKQKCCRNKDFRLRRAGGAGNEALLSWDNLPRDWQLQLIEKFGDPKHRPETHYFEQLFVRDPKAAEFYATYVLADGSLIKPEVQKEYVTNASMLNTIMRAVGDKKAFRKALGGSTHGVWDIVVKQVEAFREISGHTLKMATLNKKLAAYKKSGYEALISGKLGNQNTAKVKDEKQLAMLEQLISKHNNLDNAQISSLYCLVAEQMGWKKITAATVSNYRKEIDLYTFAGRRGETNLRNTKTMQVKRSAPSTAMVYWTLDGWDAELLFQREGLNKDKRKVTTYHNRLTVVIVLDPCCKYPVGYAIASHETPELIKEALRNAANHTKELFGDRFKPLQLQSDNYGKGALTPLYEAMSKNYTPAKVKNAKAKVIEPYFKKINKQYCQYLPNWSGFGITSQKANQPNEDYLNKIRHQFPDEQGCRHQIEHIIFREREAKRDQYLAQWASLPKEDRLPLTDFEYLDLFGQTTGWTNKLEASGFNPTLLGKVHSYDSFDQRFRELAYMDWAVKFDPEDLSKVLVVNAQKNKSTGKFEKEIATHKFILEERHIQPMALYDRQDGDMKALQRVRDYNEALEESIIERGAQKRALVDEVFEENPTLDKTLTKLIITDSNGQHKNQRNAPRLPRIKAVDLPATDFEILDDDIRNSY